MNTARISPETSRAKDAAVAFQTHYAPQHVKRKVGMVIVGLFIFAYGLSELWSPLSLLLEGKSVLGEATRVVKTKPGLPDQVFTDEIELKAAEEESDRSYLFWNEFHFATADHKDRIVRYDIGSQLKPIFPLLDDDGLPTTAQIYYDPQDPTRICIPIVISTWFAPGLITFMGAVCIVFGCLILYWARHKIELTRWSENGL